MTKFFDAPAPAARLAVLRVLAGGFATLYVLVQLPVFLALRQAPRRDFAPVGPLWWLSAPLRPGVLVAMLVAAVGTGMAFTAGAWFRLSGPLFAALFLALTTYHSSFGQVLWFENLPALHVAIVGLSPSARALALDARPRPAPPTGADYGWPVRLAALVTVLTYVLAGMAKLRIGGIAWASGTNLRNHIAYSAARLDVLGGTRSPLAAPLVRNDWLLAPAALVTLVLELGAPLALVHHRIRDVWVLGSWAMHVAIAVTMFVVFPYPLWLVAFAPLYPLERLPTRLRVWLTPSRSRP